MSSTRSTLALLLALLHVVTAMHSPVVPGVTPEVSQQAQDVQQGPARQQEGEKGALALIERSDWRGDTIKFRKCAAEFIATLLFVFFGCGSAMSCAKEGSWILQVSLSFGLAITVLAYAVGHYSGGQINSAVTFGLMLHGQVGWGEGILDIIAQLLGSVVGAYILKAVFPPEKDKTGGFATNAIQEGFTPLAALLAEFVGTFLLMYVIFETAVNPDTIEFTGFAPLAIGLAVFLAHSALIPIDGCSINPARSFGPAFVESLSEEKNNSSSPFKDMWVFWLGPLSGAATAYGIFAAMH